MLHWFEHFLGLDSPDGNWYLFWSGFGADLGMIGAVGTLWHRHACHRCWRIVRNGRTRCRKHAAV